MGTIFPKDWKEEHFKGQRNEDIQEYTDNYERAANDYVLDAMRCFNYLENLFDGHAKMYQHSNVQDKASGYTEGKRVKEEKYSKIARHNRIMEELLGLHVSRSMDSGSWPSIEALEKVREKIASYTTQVPKPQRSEEE